MDKIGFWLLIIGAAIVALSIIIKLIKSSYDCSLISFTTKYNNLSVQGFFFLLGLVLIVVGTAMYLIG